MSEGTPEVAPSLVIDRDSPTNTSPAPTPTPLLPREAKASSAGAGLDSPGAPVDTSGVEMVEVGADKGLDAGFAGAETDGGRHRGVGGSNADGGDGGSDSDGHHGSGEGKEDPSGDGDDDGDDDEEKGPAWGELPEFCLGKIKWGTKPWHIMPYAPKRYRYDLAQLRREVLSGITVAFAQLSDSIAFAFIAGVGPLLGLHAAWIIGITMSLLGSRPGLINGATGVRAAVVAPFIEDLGIGYLFYIVLMISVFQLAGGLLGLAKFVRLVPRPVMIGFVNGLAIILTLGQVLQFERKENPNDPPGTTEGVGDFITGTEMWFMWLEIAVCIIVILAVPKIPKYGPQLPASLIGIMVAAVIEHGILRPLDYSTPIIGEVSKVGGGLPVPFWDDDQYDGQLPDIDWNLLGKITMPAFIAAAAGAVEAVMTMEVVNDMTETTNEAPNQQLLALSVGNALSGLFGTMGGGATIGMSVICVKSGANGHYRLSGVVAGFSIFLFVLAASSFIELVPTASLIGVMILVIMSTFDWTSLLIILASSLPLRARARIGLERYKIKRTDAITIVIVTVVTLVQDLFIAVVAGVLFTAGAFVWESGNRVTVRPELVRDDEGKVTKKVYHMVGPLFFASAQRFMSLFTPKQDPDVVELHFHEAGTEVNDYSGLHALNFIGEKYKKLGKTFSIRHLNEVSMKTLRKSQSLVKHFDVHHGEGVTEATTDGDDADSSDTPVAVAETIPEVPGRHEFVAPHIK